MRKRESNAIKKGVIYKATCKWCLRQADTVTGEVVNMQNDISANGVNYLNMDCNKEVEFQLSVGMDGMNKSGGECSPTSQSNNSPVGMDGMNKLGGDVSPSSQTTNSQLDPLLEEDEETIQTLSELFREGGRLRGEKISNFSTTEKEKLTPPIVDKDQTTSLESRK